jgi:hypothetical protein
MAVTVTYLHRLSSVPFFSPASTAVICLKWRVAAKKPFPFKETKNKPLKITTVKVINKRKGKKPLGEKRADSASSVSDTLILS